MNPFISREKLDFYRQKYPAGTKICVDFMPNEPNPVKSGTIGTVNYVDDIGTLHCIFENGRNLGVIPGEDSFHIVQEQEICQEPQKISINMS